MFKINLSDKNGVPVDLDHPEGEPSGVVVSTRPLKTFENTIKFFSNSEYGVDFNVDASFGGTPEEVHDGTDKILWTASDITGGAKTTFNDTTHSHEGVITVVDYSIIDLGDSFTINTTTRTEGTDWTAETSNDVTAGNIATDIDNNVTGFSATASGAVVTVTADTGYDITTFSTTADADEITATAQSVRVSASPINDVFQFYKGSDLDCSGYTALTMRVYITKDWDAGAGITIYGWSTRAGSQVGNAVGLQDYFEWFEFGKWHKLTIPLTDFGGLSASTTLDALRVKVDTVGVKRPVFSIDSIRFEQTGTPVKYTLKPDVGTWLHVDSFTFSFVDAYSGVLLNSTMPKFEYNKILGVTLVSGVNYQRVQDGKVRFSTTSRGIMDMAQLAGTKWGMYGTDGTNTWVTLNHKHTEPFVLKAEDEDELSFTVSEDLSGLLQFRVSAGCKIEYRE